MKRNSVAINDDFTIVEPAEKSVRKLEEEDPSIEVLELRQKVAKLEKDYQSACRIANEYETQLQEYKGRVESLENLFDAKLIMTSSEETNELMRQLCATRTSLEASKQASGELRQKVCTQIRKVEELRIAEQSRICKVDELTQRLAEYEKLHPDANRRANELRATRTLEDSKQEIEDLYRQVNMLRRENEALRRNAMTRNTVTNELNDRLRMTKFRLEEECRKNEALQTRNNFLWRKNEELRRSTEVTEAFEKNANKLMMKLSMEGNKLDEANEVNRKLDKNELLRRQAKYEQAIGTKTSSHVASISNIFVLCPWEAPDTILFGHAVRRLQNAFFLSSPDWMEKYRRAVKDNILACNLCAGPTTTPIFEGTEILAHFFSVNHTKHIRDQHGTVSLTAFEYWMDKLDEIPKPNPLEPALPKRAESVMMLDEDVPD